jgi:hypothetical protein
MTNNCLILFFTLFLTWSCSDPGEKAQLSQEHNEEATIKEILAMFDDYHRDISEYGLRGEFDYLDSTEEFFWVPPGYSESLTYDSVRTILEQNAPAFDRIHYSWDQLKIFPFNADLASYTGIVRGSMTDTAGKTIQVRIIESGTVIKRKAGWKLLNGQSAALSPDTVN